MKLDKRVQIRCSQSEIDELDKKSKESNMSRSALLRKIIFESKIKPKNESFEKFIRYHVSNISHNQNQTTRYIHTKKAIDNKALEVMDEILNYVKIIAKRVL